MDILYTLLAIIIALPVIGFVIWYAIVVLGLVWLLIESVFTEGEHR